jgi:hypothetical protein
MKGKQPMKGQIALATNDPVDASKLDLETWWRTTSENDLQVTLMKLAEYGSHDLVEMGRALAQMAGWEGLAERELAEIGCWAYLVGKLSRATEAFAERRFPHDDTWLDVEVYSKMIRRIRDHGGWG